MKNMKNMKKYLFVASLAVIVHGALVSGALIASEYYTEPQVYSNRPHPNYEKAFDGSIGATGIETRIYKGGAITVENMQPGTPADGKFSKGDVLVGVNGVLLKGKNPYVILGTALCEAEATDGQMVFDVNPGKEGNVKKVAITIPVMGAYSRTFPLNCSKSTKIIQQAAEFYSAKKLGAHGIYNAMTCLFLLSTGDDQYVPRVKAYFYQFLTKEGKVKGLGQMTWDNGYNGIACGEYYLRTGDKAVLPILQYYCDDARDRQYWGKGWGHWGQGMNPAYEGAGGLMNAAGNQVLTTLLMGKMCGVDVDEKTLLGALKYWYIFVGHGTIPVSDTRNWFILRSAGRDGATTATMQIASGARGDVSIYKQAKEYLAMSATTSWPEMNYEFEAMWHGIGCAHLLEYDPALYHKTNERLKWWYTLSRQPSGGFVPGGLIVQTKDPVAAGVSMGLVYTAPLKTLCITGAPRSRYAKDFKLPERLWGTDADRAFLSSKHNRDFYKYGKDEEIHIPFRELPVGLGAKNTSQLPLNTLLKNARHARYSIRVAAAKSLRSNNNFGELEKLLCDPDPRLRRAGLDGIVDYKPWCGSLALGGSALKTKEYTPAMTRSITQILANRKEAWYVADGAMLALYNAPVDVIRQNIPNILPWTNNNSWWLRESSFMALMGLQKDDGLFCKVLPKLIDMYVNEYYANPNINMRRLLTQALQQKGNTSRAGKMIIAGFVRATLESKVLPDVGENKRSSEGAYNVIQAAVTASKHAPEAAADIAEALARGGRLAGMDTENLMSLLSVADGHVSDRFVGLYPAIKTQTPQNEKRLANVLYNDFRPELIKRLKADDKKDENKLIDMIIDLTRLKKPITGWQAIGTPAPAERIWRYRSFDPIAKEKIHPRIGPPKRLREVTLPAGMDNWYVPEFDDSKWNSGKTPIGKGEFKAHGHGTGWTYRPKFFYKNKSDWGAGEFLVMRNTFEVSDLDYDYFRINILSDQGYHIYLNGHKIHTYIWFEHYPKYKKIMLTPRELKYLKKGKNTLAVFGVVRFEQDKKTNEYHPVGQVDITIEGLKKRDLLGNSGRVSSRALWDDPSYKKDIPATQAVSRPVSTGWPLWMKHHEDRKAWFKDRKVDLLMVGDSIVFRWGRNGKKVWDEYYAKRNGCNIGSSGDQTQHMLWHFQNGGLEGANPKLVLVMIGTNNRGAPEKKGADTAYGILALLKEIRMQLPNSKILLMGIFPRGWTPTDVGRLRNEEINKIIRTYADNEIVYWLDIGDVFLDEKGGLVKELMPDGLHPGEKGFRVWAEAMEPTIKKLLKE
ncbi:MAG: DUF6288 domain-containing protein [Phycisphaerae bacterium]|nr:DUF6288 domain-containing protein [Phycisphaerae bacterium]